MPSYIEIIDAMMFVDAIPDGVAYYDPARDAIYLKGNDIEEEVAEIPADVDLEQCIIIPGEKELDLGRSLIEKFVTEHRHEDLGRIRSFFGRRGGYRRFRTWVEKAGLLDIWYIFRNRAETEALTRWCADNNIPLTDLPEIPTPCGPTPDRHHPAPFGSGKVIFISNCVKVPHITVGEYTYTDDIEMGRNFANQVQYQEPEQKVPLVIGRFCSIASGVRFLMDAAAVADSGFANFPFAMFGNGWEVASTATDEDEDDEPKTAGITIGHDVAIGFEALIMPGVKIGDGAIIAPRAVVTTDVPPYAVVAGMPATTIRKRFSDDVIAELLKIAWWHWDAVKITRNLRAIAGGEIKALQSAE